MSANALRDQNRIPVALGVSNTDSTVPLPFKIDSTTGRVLMDATSGITTLTATGSVNGVNTSFTFIQQPSYIVSDHSWYKATNSSGTTNWTWTGGTLTVTMTIPPTEDIFGVA